MEPISIFVVVGFVIVAISIKHIFESCKSNSNDNEEVSLVEEEIPPKYEDIYNN